MKKKLRIGLLVEGIDLAAWQLRIVEILHESSYAEIVALIINNAPKPRQTVLHRFLTHYDKLVWRLHEWVDEKLFRPMQNPFKRVTINGILHHTTQLSVTPRQTRFCDYLLDSDIEKIKQLNLDVALRFGFRIIKGDFLAIAKYGIWSYHHADNRVNRGTPPGYWEVVKRQRLTGVTLQILQSELDGGVVLYKSWSATHPVSIARNKAQIYWKAVRFIPRKLEELYQTDADSFFTKHQPEKIDVYDRPLFLVPGNMQASVLFLKHVLFLIKDAWKRFWFANQWVLLVSFDSKKNINLRKFIELSPPRNAFWADPFAYQRDNRNFIFFEEYPYVTQVGRLAVIEVDQTGRQLNYWPLLQKEYHLSYPFVFEADGSLYMIPETSENKSIDLYMCTTLPNQWVFQKTLMTNVLAVDSTLLYKDNIWWMFTTLQQEKGASKNEELFIFFSDRFDSTDWKPHPGNPVVSDVRGGRMGGRFIEQGNKIFRVAQNGEGGYGGSISIFEIIQLDKHSYQEVLFEEIEAKWSKKYFRVHTFDRYNNMVVLDALKKKFRWL